MLDLGTRIAAPFCAGLLGEQGAEVIKVEQPGGGDFMREIGPFVDTRRRRRTRCSGRSRAAAARASRSTCARPRARTCSAGSRRPPTSSSRTSGPARSSSGTSARPTSTRGSSSCASAIFGQDGPYSPRPGLDRVGIGYGGLLHLTGYPDRPPVRVGVTISDYLTGVFAAQAAIAALYARDARGGAGAVIDAALYGAVLRILEWTLAGVRPARHRAQPRGQPARELGAARQLPDRRRQVRVHRRRLRRQLRPAVQGDGPPRPARRPALRAARRPRRARRRDQRHRRRVDRDARPRPRSRSAASRTTCRSRPRTPRPTSSPTRTWPHRGDLVTVDDPVVGAVRQQAPFPRFVGEAGRRAGRRAAARRAHRRGARRRSASTDAELDDLAARGRRVTRRPVHDGLFELDDDGTIDLVGGYSPTSGQLPLPAARHVPVLAARPTSNACALSRDGDAVGVDRGHRRAARLRRRRCRSGSASSSSTRERLRVITRLTEADPARARRSGSRCTLVADDAPTTTATVVTWAFAR